MQPYDYRLNPVPQNITSGIKQGVLLSQIMNQPKQQEAQAQAQASMQSDLARLANNRNATVDDYRSMMTKYPTMAENLKRSVDVLNEDQKKNTINEASQIYSAVSSGRPDVAVGILERKKEAAINSGNKEEAQKTDIMLQLVKTNPEAAKTSTALLLSASDPEKFAENLTKIQGEQRKQELQPGEVEKQGEDIATSKLDRQIKVAEQARKNADSEAKRNEIQAKIDELSRKRDDIMQKNEAEIEGARMSIDNLINTADKILETPIGVIKAASGPVDQMFPTVQRDVADLEELFNTLDAQAFISQIPTMTGKGALSDSEGKKLSASLQNLSLRQSPDRLIDNVEEVQRLMLKARKNLAKKYGVKETVPDTPAAFPTREELDKIVERNLGNQNANN